MRASGSLRKFFGNVVLRLDFHVHQGLERVLVHRGELRPASVRDIACSSAGECLSISAGGMGFRTSAVLVWPKKTGSASRATNRKIRNTIRMAESETRKMNFSASHSSGRALWPRWMPIQPGVRRDSFCGSVASNGGKVRRAERKSQWRIRAPPARDDRWRNSRSNQLLRRFFGSG